MLVQWHFTISMCTPKCSCLASDILGLVRATIHTHIFDFNSFSRVRTTSQSFNLAPLLHARAGKYRCEDSPTSSPFLPADLETHTDTSHLRIIASWDLSAALRMLHPRPATAAHANSTLARTAAPTTISPKPAAWKPSASSCFKPSPFRQLMSTSSYNGRAERRLLRPLE